MKCSECNSIMEESVNDERISLIETGKKVTIKKYVCLKCGHVKQHADIKNILGRNEE